MAADEAVFNSETNRIPANVASAAVAAGLPLSSIDPFVACIVAQNHTGAATVPGVTDQIMAAGTEAVVETYVQAFRYVWLSAIPFLAIAAIGMCSLRGE